MDVVEISKSQSIIAGQRSRGGEVTLGVERELLLYAVPH